MKTPPQLFTFALLVCSTLGYAQPASQSSGGGGVKTDRILRIAEMNTMQIRALDRAHTVVFLPIGILEQHGPYLPSFTDGYAAERMTAQLADAVVQRPDWTAVVFPTLPLGQGGANEIGWKAYFPGSYTVRPETLRAVMMDFATALGEQGFRWIMIVDCHGSPIHKRVLDQAAAYFHDEYGHEMINLFGLAKLMVSDSVATQDLTAAQRAEDGFTVHAGMRETSNMLFLRPDLVAADFAKAPSLPAANFAGLVELGRRDDWPGYFGAPRLAVAEAGARRWKVLSEKATTAMFALLDGTDNYRTLARYSDSAEKNPAQAVVSQKSYERAKALAEKQKRWLSRNGIP